MQTRGWMKIRLQLLSEESEERVCLQVSQKQKEADGNAESCSVGTAGTETGWESHQHVPENSSVGEGNPSNGRGPRGPSRGRLPACVSERTPTSCPENSIVLPSPPQKERFNK